MKLYGITMINSGNFSFAHLTLDSNSIQLSGRNNKGKTSLLWTLPLLFVVDRKQAVHPNYTPKESMNFYFRSSDMSYIIFEGYDERQGYFYMLLRRDGDNIKYYFVKKKFDSSMFIQYDETIESYIVLPFNRILENPATGIGAPLKDKREVLARAIISKKGEVGFLRLSQDSKSYQFSNLYKHLFRSGSDDEILKNGILIVNGLKKEALNMRNEIPLSYLAGWKREQDEINTLKEIQQDLADLREKRNNMEGKKTLFSSELITFGEIDFNQVRKLVNNEYKKYEKQIRVFSEMIKGLEKDTEIAKEKISGFYKDEGSIETKIAQHKENINTINGYPNEIWLKQELQNTEKDNDSVRSLIRGIDTVISVEEIDKKMGRLLSRKKEVEQFVHNNKDTLLMNLANNKGDIGVINTVLSDAVISLPKTAILSNITDLKSNTFSFNSANINISSLEIKEVPTIEERKNELQEIKQDIERIIKIKKNFNKKKELEEKKRGLEKEIQNIRNKLSELSKLDYYNKELSESQKKLYKVQEQRKIEEDKGETLLLRQKERKIQRDEVIAKQKSLKGKEKNIDEFYNTYLEYCKAIMLTLSPSKSLSVDMINDMVQKKQDILKEKYNEFINAEELYNSATRIIKRYVDKIDLYDNNNVAEEDDLLTLLERKCEHVDIKNKELQDKILATTNIFRGRIKRFLEQIENIKRFTIRINNMLSKYTISDLSGIHIRFIPNEDQIKEIEQLSLDKTSLFSQRLQDAANSDETIFRYIRTEKTVLLSDLFEIGVERTKKDKREKSKQSNGTERMLHVMLLLILMRELIHPDDTIPFLIDEVMDIDDINQDELLKFFDELNLLPISASPHIAHTFQKIYYIEEDVNGKSYINENTCTRKTDKEKV